MVSLPLSCAVGRRGEQDRQTPCGSLPSDRMLSSALVCLILNTWPHCCRLGLMSSKLPLMAGTDNCSARGYTAPLDHCAKATFNAVSKIYSSLTPDLWKEAVRSPSLSIRNSLTVSSRPTPQPLYTGPSSSCGQQTEFLNKNKRELIKLKRKIPFMTV